MSRGMEVRVARWSDLGKGDTHTKDEMAFRVPEAHPGAGPWVWSVLREGRV